MNGWAIIKSLLGVPVRRSSRSLKPWLILDAATMPRLTALVLAHGHHSVAIRFNREPRETCEMKYPNPVRVFGVFRGYPCLPDTTSLRVVSFCLFPQRGRFAPTPG
jgi:hypothetical protein